MGYNHFVILKSAVWWLYVQTVINMDFDIFVNCNWVVTRYYSTHLHTGNT